jgi:DNA-binding protein H-NS
MSKKLNLDAMSVDEMWQLHEKIAEILSIRLTAEKRELEKRLAKLRRDNRSQPAEQLKEADREEPHPARRRRKYPKVFPKYQNPSEPSETWSGRGKQPRWLTAALMTGRAIEEFIISDAESNKGGRRMRV